MIVRISSALKFRAGDSFYFSVIEPTTPCGCPFQPAMHRIPGNALDSSDGGLVETFQAESGHFIKRGATVVKSMIRRPDCRAECLPTSSTLVATTLAPPSPIEAMAYDGLCTAVFRGRAVRIGTAETLHGWWTLGERTDGPELSLKLYHAWKLPLSYQQLMTEAPFHD